MHIEIPRSLALSKRITAILTAKNEHFVCNELHCRKIFVLYCVTKKNYVFTNEHTEISFLR